jgi:hypothetical protein
MQAIRTEEIKISRERMFRRRTNVLRRWQRIPFERGAGALLAPHSKQRVCACDTGIDTAVQQCHEYKGRDGDNRHAHAQRIGCRCGGGDGKKQDKSDAQTETTRGTTLQQLPPRRYSHVGIL